MNTSLIDWSLSPPIEVYAIVGTFRLLIWSYQCTIPAYGSVGSFSMDTDREALKIANLNLYTITMSAEAVVPVFIHVVIGGIDHTIFGGELDDTSWSFDSDTVTISGRSFAGVLVDAKRVLVNTSTLAPSAVPSSIGTVAGSINVQNQTPQQVITEIAIQNGLTPVPVNTQLIQPLVGSIIANNATFTAKPLPEWDIIQGLSRLMGWEAYISANRELIFGRVGLESNIWSFTWNVAGSSYPCKDLTIQHNPRRNSTFVVIVTSYHLATIEHTTGFVAIPSNQMVLNYPQYKTDGRGFYTASSLGPDTSAVTAIFHNLGKEIYLFQDPGKTQDQVQQKAEEMALSIAKREIIANFKIDGQPLIQPLEKVNLVGALSGFEGRSLYINSVHHTFSMPAGGSGGISDDAFMTEISCWSLPASTAATNNPGIAGP